MIYGAWHMDMNGSVNQRDSINYNWPLLAVTQGLVSANTQQRLLFQKLLAMRQTYKHMCAYTHTFTHRWPKWMKRQLLHFSLTHSKLKCFTLLGLLVSSLTGSRCWIIELTESECEPTSVSKSIELEFMTYLQISAWIFHLAFPKKLFIIKKPKISTALWPTRHTEWKCMIVAYYDTSLF